jgi:short-subunit dehydrogenase
MNIKGKVVIVTGASYGIGLETARLLFKQGAKLALTARTKKKLDELAAELPGAATFPADMSVESEARAVIGRALKHFGNVDILINNAGQGYDASVESTDTALFHKIFELNVIGPLAAMQEVIPVMRKQKEGGVIVNVSSATALMYLPDMGAYSSTKRMLNGITLTAREELKGDNIRLSVVYPYITKTGFENNTLKNKGQKAEAFDFDILVKNGRPPADTPEYVAGKILEAITTEKPEVFVHDWMGKMSKG